MQADTIRISRLRLRGPGGARQSLLSQLACADWPAPPDQGWVLVRRVTVRGSTRQLPAELVAETRKLARGSGEPDNVVRFASFAELLADLTRDLASGTASQHWYWRQWSHLFPLRRGEAIGRLMTEHYQHLNSLCCLLAASSTLVTVWQTLEPVDARQITQALAHGTGVRFAALSANVAETHDINRHAGALAALPAATVARWQPVLRTLQQDDARFRLSLMLIALESQALALRQAPAMTLGRVQQQLVPAPQGPGPVSGKEVGGKQEQGDYFRVTSGLAIAGRPAQVRAAPNQSPSSTDSNSRARRGTPEPGGSYPEQAGHDRHNEPGPRPPATGGARAASDSVADAPGHDTPDVLSTLQEEPERFHTRMGGTLYLLNVLNRPQLQRIMETEWQTLASGWGWLYRLAETLDPDPADPLSEFLARQLGLASSGALTTLPPLPRKDEILALVWQWYGDELWRPDMLRIPAQLSHSPSHLDLIISARYVRLDLRLAGLDINPGWLPWLGRVVNFHYQPDPDPRGNPS